MPRLKTFLRDYVLLTIEWPFDWLIGVCVSVRHPRTSRYSTVLAAPGGGSVGDQAMLDVYLSSVRQPALVVTRRTDDVSVDDSSTKVIELPRLIYGRPFARFSEVAAFIRVARRSSELAIVGADVLDGAYGALPSVRRFRLARLSATFGAPARVLGFSWNEQPHPLARRAMRRASRRVRLLVRDPQSLMRVRGDGAKNAVAVADLAFLSPGGVPPEELTDWIAVQRAGGREVSLVNVHGGALAINPDVIEATAQATERLLSLGSSVVLLPNDDRAAASDADALRHVGRLIGESPFIRFVDAPLTPSEVVGLAESCDFCLTGRMHLAILAACGAVPSVTMGYQGKVAGLYQLLGVSTYVDLPSVRKDSLAEAVTEAYLSRSASREAIQNALPRIRELALLNLRQ